VIGGIRVCEQDVFIVDVKSLSIKKLIFIVRYLSDALPELLTLLCNLASSCSTHAHLSSSQSERPHPIDGNDCEK
jgi:hypothetical protein